MTALNKAKRIPKTEIPETSDLPAPNDIKTTPNNEKVNPIYLGIGIGLRVNIASITNNRIGHV